MAIHHETIAQGDKAYEDDMPKDETSPPIVNAAKCLLSKLHCSNCKLRLLHKKDWKDQNPIVVEKDKSRPFG